LELGENNHKILFEKMKERSSCLSQMERRTTGWAQR
jgi:hypothetical protein